MSTLAPIILRAFQRFAAAHRVAVPRCRERELVNRYAVGHLLPLVAPGSALLDARRIGIDVAVSQRSGDGARRQPAVREPLVIRAEPESTCWNEQGQAVRLPAAVVEWKSIDCRERRASQADKVTRQLAYDPEWLGWLTGKAGTEGSCALVQPEGAGLRVEVTRVCGTT